MIKLVKTRLLIVLVMGIFAASGCSKNDIANEEVLKSFSAAETVTTEAASTEAETTENTSSEITETEASSSEDTISEEIIEEDISTEARSENPSASSDADSKIIRMDPSWKYADFSKINDGTATLYYADPSIAKDITICINAGHGTNGGTNVKTQCHPDGSPKVTGGSTAEGSTMATAVSTGTTMLDGTPEATVTLKASLAAKNALLEAGYNVLMIRENDDVQLDNIARTVIANNLADCHIAIHYDSSENNNGAFFCGVPDNKTYRSMEPVATHWQDHERLGKCIIDGLRSNGIKINGNGEIPIDLTQTSYSTIPSIDLEIGDRASDYSDDTLSITGAGIVDGINAFFK